MGMFFILSAFVLVTGNIGRNRRIIPQQRLTGVSSRRSQTIGRNSQVANTSTSGTVNLVIELDDEPTVQTFARTRRTRTVREATTSGRQQLTTVEQSQQSILPTLAKLGATILYRTQRVYNGIAVAVDTGQIDAIRNLPHVKAVHPLIPKHLINANSVPFINAPTLWNSSGLNVTGNGMRIGVIDTGIDYRHADFGGTASSVFPTSKVDGHDFVELPADPMDCDGHGTHVAATLAGFGVNADGSTYSGPYGPNTPFSSLKIGPGVAPNAKLYALKVFDCSGNSFRVDQAIEWAVDPNGDGDFSDHLDVVNMSLGVDFGATDDPTAVASDNAALAGMIVVAATGNAGDTYYSAGAPAISDRTIAVAASLDNATTTEHIQINSPPTIAGPMLSAALDFPPLFTSSLIGDLVIPSESDGCTQPTDDFTGKVALIDRGNCDDLFKVFNVQKAHAAGAIIVSDNDEPPFPFDENVAQILIPSVVIGRSDGDRLKSALNSGSVNVTLLPNSALLQPNLADTLAFFSSRGPRVDGNVIKPDLTAPGYQIFSALLGSGSGGVFDSGTSMASPHVAGLMALLRQLHPGWTVEELKALAMNTATHNVRSGSDANSPIYSPTRIGAGRVDANLAALSNSIAYNADGSGQVSISFGAPEVVAQTSFTKQLRISNKSGAAVTYSLAYTPTSTIPGVDYQFPNGSNVTVAANSFVDVPLQLSVNPALMQHTHDITISENQTGPRFWLSEADGFLVVTPTSANALRVPVYAAPRAASAVHAVETGLDVSSGTALIHLAGIGFKESGSPADASLVSAFELGDSAGINPAVTKGYDRATKLQYVGVSSDYLTAGSMAKTTLYFAIATYGNWSSPNTVHFDVQIFPHGNSTPVYELQTSTLGDILNVQNDDSFCETLTIANRPTPILATYALNGKLPSGLNISPFNTNIMIMSVAAADIGLTDSQSVITYSVTTERTNNLFDLGMDRTDGTGIDFDVAHPGLSFSSSNASVVDGMPTFFDSDGKTITVTYNNNGFPTTHSGGILLLHHSNTDDNNADFIPVYFNSPVPVLAEETQRVTQVGSPAFSLDIRGESFVRSSVLLWDGSPRPTHYLNGSELSADISAADVAVAKTVNLQILTPAPGGGLSNILQFVVVNSGPTLTSATPNTVLVGGPGFTVTIQGTGFMPGAVARWVQGGFFPLNTTYVSSTEVTAFVPASFIATIGTPPTISVDNPPPGGTSANFVVIFVNNPVPAITSMSPNGIPAGTSDFTLTINGSGFEPGYSFAYWNGTRLGTTVASSTQLAANVPASDVAAQGTVAVTVFTFDPGGGTSNSLNFNIGPPAAVVTSLSPTSALINGAPFMLTVNGLNFVNNSTVLWNGTPRATTFVSNQRLMASILAGDLTQVGNALVTVSNPGQSPSNSETLLVQYGLPAITGLQPNTAVAGSTALALTIIGSNFAPTSTVQYNGATHTSAFIDPTNLQISLSAADLVNAGTATVVVTNPTPGGGTSNTQQLPINNPVPVIGGTSPTNLFVNGSRTLLLNGSGFVTTSQATVNGADRTTVFISNTSVRVTVAPEDLSSTGTLNLNVFNPAPMGGMSNGEQVGVVNPAPTFQRISPTATYAGSPAMSIGIFGSNFLSGVTTVEWNSVQRAAQFIDETHLQISASQLELQSAESVTISVVNPAPGGGQSTRTFNIVGVKTQSADAASGSNAIAALLASQNTDPSISAQLNHIGSNGAATVSVDVFDGNPTGEGGPIDDKGGFVGLQVANGSPGDTVTANFYYPADINAQPETSLRLLYFDGAKWKQVKGSGNSSPQIDITDNLDGTLSGGRFTVVFDNSSTPGADQLSGTIFTVSRGLYGDLNSDFSVDIIDLVLLANGLAGNLTVDQQAADVFQDGKFSIADLVTLANYLAGNLDQLPVQPLGANSESPATNLTLHLSIASRHVVKRSDWMPSHPGEDGPK